MKNLSEAMFVLERAGILVEEYPGKCYGDWLAYFNVFSDDYGNTKIEDIASLLTNNDEYWENSRRRLHEEN